MPRPLHGGGIIKEKNIIKHMQTISEYVNAIICFSKKGMSV
jgi:hypothetical protein